MFTDFLKEKTILAVCEKCGSKMSFTLNDIASKRCLVCSKCGSKEKFNDPNGDVKKLLKVGEDLDNTIKKLH